MDHTLRPLTLGTCYKYWNATQCTQNHCVLEHELLGTPGVVLEAELLLNRHPPSSKKLLTSTSNMQYFNGM